jgi:hypothetical protein
VSLYSTKLVRHLESYLRNNSILFDAVKLEFEVRRIRGNPREEDISRFYTAQVSRQHVRCRNFDHSIVPLHSLHWMKNAELSVI